MYEVDEGRLGKCVRATEVLPEGQVVLRGWGYRVPRRTRHSIQVDHDTHVVINTPIEMLNHSCEPNCGVLVRLHVPILEIQALRRIEPGEELVIDYAMFESEIEFMTEPCLCGTAACRGQITGYRDLPEDVRASYGPYIASYLRQGDADDAGSRRLTTELAEVD